MKRDGETMMEVAGDYAQWDLDECARVNLDAGKIAAKTRAEGE